MKLVFNENGKPIAIFNVYDVICDSCQGKTNILITCQKTKYFIRIPDNAAELIMNTFLSTNIFRVERSCFKKWEDEFLDYIKKENNV